MADRGNSMTDTSPLVQIKQALKQIKLEVVTFDLQIGVVGHSLMQQKLRHGNPKQQNSTGFKLRGKLADDSTPPFDDSDAESL
jgi:estrogen-related receptor beta like 1